MADSTMDDVSADTQQPRESLEQRMARVAKERGIKVAASAPTGEPLEQRMARIAKERGIGASAPLKPEAQTSDALAPTTVDVPGDIDLGKPPATAAFDNALTHRFAPPSAPAAGPAFSPASVGLVRAGKPPALAPIDASRASAPSDVTAAPQAAVAPPSRVIGIRQPVPSVVAGSLSPETRTGGPQLKRAAPPTPPVKQPDGSEFMSTMKGAPAHSANDLLVAPTDATRVGDAPGPTINKPTIESALQAGLSDVKQLDPSTYAPTSKLGKAAVAAGEMASHPVSSAAGLVAAPFQSAWTLGRYARQSLEAARGAKPGEDAISRKDAAFAAGQLIAMGASEAILPMLDKVFGEQMAQGVFEAVSAGESPAKALALGYAKHVGAHAIGGAAVGATFAKDDPAMGAILGAAIGGVHAAAGGAHVAIPSDGISRASMPDALLDTPGKRPIAPDAAVRVAAADGAGPTGAHQPDYHVSPLDDEAAPTLPSAAPAPATAGGANETLDQQMARVAKEQGIGAQPDATHEVVPTDGGARPYVPESSGLHVTVEQMLTRNIARGLKTAHPDAIAHAAPEMAQRVPDNAVLVPLPDHTGSTVANAELADAISQHANADVADVLGRSAQTTDSGALRDKGKPGLTADEHEASMVANGDLPKDRPVVFVDNIETTGATAEGARRVLGRPDAQLVAFAKAPIPAGESPAMAKADQPGQSDDSLGRGPQKQEPTAVEKPSTSSTSSDVEKVETPPAPSEKQHVESDRGTLDEQPNGAVDDAGHRDQPSGPGTGDAASAVEPGGRGSVPRASDEPSRTDERVADSAGKPEASDVAAASSEQPSEEVAGGAKALGDRPHVPGPVGRSDAVHFSDGSSIKTRYRVIEAEHLQPSHNSSTFAPNPAYPAGVQGREYSGSRGTAARQHVETETGKLRSAPLLDAGGGTTDGPPVITPHGLTIAGNQRAMMLRRATSAAPERYQAYRDDLMARAASFGVDPEQVRSMKAPVLVREIADPSVNTNDVPTLSRLNQLSDQTPTKTKDALSSALGRAKQMQQAGSSLAHFNETIGPDETIREYLGTAAGGQFVRKLLEDGVVAPQERGAFIDGHGAITPSGKDAIEAALRVAAIGDPDVIHRAPPAILRKMESAIPAIIQANATKEYALTHDVQSALDLLARVEAMKADMQSRGEKVGGFSLANYLQQQDIFGNDVPANISDFATFIERAPKALVTSTLREYAKHALAATEASQSDDIFGHTPEPKPALSNRLFRAGESRVGELSTAYPKRRADAVWERKKADAHDQLSLFNVTDENGIVTKASDAPKESAVSHTPAQFAAVKRVVRRTKMAGLPASGERRQQILEAAKRDLIDPVGRYMRNAEEAADLMKAFRHPAMEIFHGFLKGADGRVAAHAMSSSGVINMSQIPASFVADIVAMSKRTGATDFEAGHNHPSGEVVPSTDDLALQGALAKEMESHGIRLIGQTIINHDTASYIAHLGNSFSLKTVPITPDTAPWKTGREMGAPRIDDANSAVQYLSSATDADAVTVGLLDHQRSVVAMAPQPIAMLDSIHEWLQEMLTAHAAVQAILMVPQEHGRALAERISAAQDSFARNGEWSYPILDVISVKHSPNGVPLETISYASRVHFQPRPVPLADAEPVELRPGAPAAAQVAQVRRLGAAPRRPEQGDVREASGRRLGSGNETGRVPDAYRVGEPDLFGNEDHDSDSQEGSLFGDTDSSPRKSLAQTEAEARQELAQLHRQLFQRRRLGGPTGEAIRARIAVLEKLVNRDQKISLDEVKRGALRYTAEPKPEGYANSAADTDEPVTGVKNAVSALDRERLGMGPRQRPEPRTQEQMYDAGKRLADDDPTAIPKMLRDLRANPEKIIGTKEEAGLLLKHRVDLDKKLKALLAAKDEAVANEDAEAERQALLQLAEHREEIKEFVTLAERTGTASGRALAARKMMSKLDYSLSHMETMAESAKGSALTRAELDRIKALHDELQVKLAGTEKDLVEARERAANAEMDLYHAQLRAEAMKPLMDRVAKSMGTAADAARARIKARGLRAMAGMDPEELADHAIIGAAALAKGAMRFADWSREMTAELGDSIKPHLQEVFDASNEKLNAELKRARATEPKKVGGKPGKAPSELPTKAPTDIRAKLKARLDDGSAIGELRPYLRQLALEHIRNGITGREALLDALYKDVLETGASVTRAQMRDALSGYGNFTALDKAADKVKLREIQAEAQKLAQLEALQKGEAPLASGFERQAPNDETRQLAKQVNDAKRKAGIGGMDDSTRLKSALSAAKTRARNAITDLRTEIDTGQRIVSGKHVPIGDAELDSLRAELAELRKMEAEVFGKPGLSDEQRLSRATAAAKRTADLWQDKLTSARAGAFQTPGRLQRPSSPQIEALRAKADLARQEYKELRSFLDPPKEIHPLRNPKAPAVEGLDGIERSDGGVELGEGQANDADPAEDLTARGNPDIKKGARDQHPDDVAERRDRSANEYYRRVLAKREADLLDRMARQDYGPKPLHPGTRFDRESLKRKADVEEVKQRFQDEVRKFEKANRTRLEKVRDGAVAFTRASVLSSPMVILKLTSVALSRVVTTPLTDAVALGVANALPRLAKGAPRYGTRSAAVALRAEAAAQAAMWTDGLRDAGRQLMNKQSRLTLLHGKHKLPHEWYEYAGSIHAALKEPVKRAEYARALYRLTFEAMQRGENTTDDFVKLRLSTEAYLHAEGAVAMNDNLVTDAWKAGLQRLDRKDPTTGKKPLAGLLLSGALKTDMPIMKAPTNVVIEASEFIGGLPLGAWKAAWHYAHGIEDLKPVERDSIIRLISKGAVGMAIMALYFYKHDQIDFGGFYQKGEKRAGSDVPADAMRVGSHVVPKMFLHNPVFYPAQFAATVGRLANTRLHRRDEDPVGYQSAVVAAAIGLSQEVPLAGGFVNDLESVFDPKRREGFLDRKAASIMVPSIIQWVAKKTDPDGDVARKPVGLKQHLQNNIPILRGQVPVDEKKQRRVEHLSQR